MSNNDDSFYGKTPVIAVLDNRGLRVREIQYHRHPDTPDTTDERITGHQYDELGFLARSTDPRLHALSQADNSVRANFAYLYSLAGEVVRTESVDAGITEAVSDAAGRPFLAVAGIGRDSNGAEERSQAVTRTFQYENAELPGRALSITEQSAGEAARITERFAYAGNTQAEKDLNLAGQRVRHYDTAGVVQTESVALSGVPLRVTRQLLKDEVVADWQGTDASAWNDLLAAETFTTQSTADATGAVLTTTDAKGNVQRVAYDVAGLLSGSWLTLKGAAEQVIVASLTYSAAGQKLREAHGNGVVTTYTYEAETQRLTAIRTERPAGHAAGAKVLQDLRYEYDPVGNVLGIKNDAEETRFWRNQKVVPENAYVYDSLYQLVSASGRERADIAQQGASLPSPVTPLASGDGAYTSYTRTYDYDSGGNLTQMRHGAPASGNVYTTRITVSSRSNRAVLSTLTENPAEVDALFTAGGQQKSLQPGQSLTWTPRGELLQVTPVVRDGAADDGERYRYDAGSQRILKVSTQKTNTSTQTQRVLYLPGLELRTLIGGTTGKEHLHVISVGEAGRAQVRVLHWESGKPDGTGNDMLRYSYDNLLGSSGLEVDGSGNIISLEEYYPYGGTAVWTARSAVEADYKTVRYSGKERDATGLYYYGYRYYQPWAGRWLSADPAGTVDGLNLYRMVRNNPVTLMDIDGRVPHPRINIPGSNLYKPKLNTGEDLSLPGASYPPFASYKNEVLEGKVINLASAINDNALKKEPLLTDLINPSKIALDTQSMTTLLNREGGGVFSFNAIKVRTSAEESFNALRIVDTHTTTLQRGSGAVMAYWAPQGGYVDIPLHPEKGEPELVFTPGFSGCSFVADKLNDTTLRVRHVEGRKEDKQYNEITDHGFGMIEAMEYSHYGFHINEKGVLLENIQGSAFMQYQKAPSDSKGGFWEIKFQKIINSPSIQSLQEGTSGFFQKEKKLNITAKHAPSQNYVRFKRISLAH